jgi:hypothetical protein
VKKPIKEAIKRGLSWFCSIEHAVEFSLVKAANDADKAKKDKNNAFDKKVKDDDAKYQLKLTQPVFNKLRKLQEFKWFADRGLEPTCISCDKPNMDWCNGHFKTRGSQKALALDPMNSYLQCNRYCNMGLSANINGNKTTRGYLQGLRDRFGEAKAQEIIDYCEIDRKAEWTGLELIAMRKQMRKEIKELEKGL